MGAGEHYLEQPSKFRQAQLDSTIYLTFDKVSCQGLDNNKPLASDLRAFDNITDYLAKMSWRHCRLFISLYIVLVAQVLLEFFDFMNPFEKAVPAHTVDSR